MTRRGKIHRCPRPEHFTGKLQVHEAPRTDNTAQEVAAGQGGKREWKAGSHQTRGQTAVEGDWKPPMSSKEGGDVVWSTVPTDMGTKRQERFVMGRMATKSGRGWILGEAREGASEGPDAGSARTLTILCFLTR